jgi:citronellol/citronellal dehydrogenase
MNQYAQYGRTLVVTTMRVLVTGASRGIGRAVAAAFARHHGPDLVVGLLARSHRAPVHAQLEGSLAETARAVENHGGTAIALPTDLRDVGELRRSIRTFLDAAGGLDVLVNNASALATKETDKQADLVHEVNARGTRVCLDACRDALLQSPAGSVVTVAPPIRLGRLEWIRDYGVAYTLSKYSMTLATLAEARADLRANCLWPRRTVSSAATARLEDAGILPGAFTRGRDPREVAEAIYALAVEKTEYNAECLLDEDVLPLSPSTAPLDAYVDELVTTSDH